MYELLTASGGNWTLFFCLLAGTGLIGLAAGGAPGVGSLAAPVIALGFTRFDKPQALVTPLLIMGQIKCLSWPQRSHIQTRVIFRALVPATAGMLLGILFWAWLIALPDSEATQQVVKLACGMIVLSISLDILLARVLRIYTTPQLGWKLSVLLAFLGGILSTVANVAGALFTWHFQSKGLNKNDLTASVACFFLILNILKLPFYVWLGMFHYPSILQSVEDWLVLAVLAGFAWVMWQVGAYWRSHASERSFAAPIAAAGLSVGMLIIIQSLRY